LSEMKVYFSDFFDIDEDVVESYGAVNISLINDLPLFIDPFLLFNSDKEEYKNIHQSIIRYLLFLKKTAGESYEIPKGMLRAWYHFPEVRQTWLGFSLSGNSGHGLGDDFADNLYHGLRTTFSDFGNESVPKSPHLEKLCLISPLVGRDKISDFTTNFAKEYLLNYNQNFAKLYLEQSQCKEFSIPKVCFDYQMGKWHTKKFTLPYFNGDFVLLTPRDMLTRDDTFINRADMIRNLENIAPSVEDATLRFELNNYFMNVLTRKTKEIPKKEKNDAAIRLIMQFPELIDYYLKYKEDNEHEATSISTEAVRTVTLLFNKQLQALVSLLHKNTDFYSEQVSSHEATYNRVIFLKRVIEDMDGYRLFYVDGKPVKREADLQVMYRLVWFASDFDVNREVNNGRGPVDFKISKGSKDVSLVEFKLASNSKLKNNLAKQVEIYQKANATNYAIKVILYFSDAEYARATSIINELGLSGNKDIVLIDARNEKVSASNVKL